MDAARGMPRMGQGPGDRGKAAGTPYAVTPFTRGELHYAEDTYMGSARV